MGLTITQFMIENISVPPEVEAALDKRTQMGVLGNLDQYTKFQAANALEDAANNPGGGMGASMGMGMGMGMGQSMAEAMRTQSPGGQGGPGHGVDAGQGAGGPGAATGGPPPLPAETQWYVGVGGQHVDPDAVLRLELGAQRLQPALVTGDDDEVVAARGELVGEGLADAGAGAGDECGRHGADPRSRHP